MTSTAEAPAVATESEWGDPKFKTFKKRFIRLVRENGSSAWVHNEIADIVREIFAAAAEPIGEVAAFDLESTDLAAQYGTYLALPYELEYERWGFTIHGDGIVFGGSLDDARARSAEAQTLTAARYAESGEVPAEEEAWATSRPGSRPLAHGAKGDDVQFLQYLAGVTPDGIYGQETEDAVIYLRRRHGVPDPAAVEGEPVIWCDGDFWGSILPRKTLYSLSQGDAGFRIRVLQAALAAYDWAEPHLVSGRFGVETAKAVRRMQANHNLRITGRVRNAEWVVLVDAPHF